jgi:prepilin signal peptidase PulO-like enzyme (type II secretory pathway)
MQLAVARLGRDPSTAWLGLMGLVGSTLIVAVWLFMPQANWVGLLTALAGMAASGGLIWLVRIIGSATLGREAMGFGDVTLMAMIGAFLGWQSSLVIFFLAPLAGVVVGTGLWIVRRENEIPYGPFLCLAAVVLLVCWPPIWGWMGGVIFELRLMVPAIVLICLVAMAVLLGFFRLARSLFG